ncbi:MAG: ammonium transporter, partial [Snowella sp.]
MLEAGFCRTSNAVNILAKNLMVFCVAALAYWLVGFGLMFGDGNSFAGNSGFLFELVFPDQNNLLGFPLGFSELAKAWPGRSFVALFFFQLVFAGTGATIISGAVAERIRFWAFILFTFILIAILYPLSGHWAWAANGWLLNEWKFRDFAGSTVVHSVGGAAALVGAWLMKPRDGRFGYNYQKDKYEEEETRRFLPYNLGFATLGCFLLLLFLFVFPFFSSLPLSSVPSFL